MSDREEPGGLRRWLIPALLVGVIVASLGFVGWALTARGGDGDVWKRADALRADDADPGAERTELRNLAEDFIVQFHTYGPEDLEDGELTGYHDRVAKLMTAKFKAAFDNQITLPLQTVTQIRAKSTGEAQASGVVTSDADSAEVLVGGVSQLSYRNPEDKKKRVKGGERPFRYRVMLVKTGGKWLVDDLDEIGDDLPGLAEQTGNPTDAPSSGATQPGDGTDSGSSGATSPSGTEATP